MSELERLLASDTAGADTAREVAEAFGAAVRFAAPASPLAKKPEVLTKIVRGIISYESALFKATAKRVMVYVRRALRVASGGGGGAASARTDISAAASAAAAVKLKAGRDLPLSTAAASAAAAKAGQDSASGDAALVARLRSAVNADGGAHDATLAPFEEQLVLNVVAPAAKLLVHTCAVHGDWYGSVMTE